MFEGTLKKMQTESTNPINYFLNTEGGFLHLNQCLGRTIQIQHIGSQCLNCSQLLPIFRQGFCKSCFFDSHRDVLEVLEPSAVQSCDFCISGNHTLIQNWCQVLLCQSRYRWPSSNKTFSNFQRL